MLKNSVILFPGIAHLLSHWKPLQTALKRYFRCLVVSNWVAGEDSGLCEQFVLVERVFYYWHCFESLVHISPKKEKKKKADQFLVGVIIVFKFSIDNPPPFIVCYLYQSASAPFLYAPIQSNSKRTNFYSKAKQFYKILLTEAHVLLNSQRCPRLQEKEPLCAHKQLWLFLCRCKSKKDTCANYHDLAFSNWTHHKEYISSKERIEFRVKF